MALQTIIKHYTLHVNWKVRQKYINNHLWAERTMHQAANVNKRQLGNKIWRGICLTRTVWPGVGYKSYEWDGIVYRIFVLQEQNLVDPVSKHLDAPKAIVFMSCLLQLFSMCQVSGCASAIDPENIDVLQHGAVVVIRYTCNMHHSGEWCSSPALGEGKKKVWVLNALLATFSLTCGLHISQVKDCIVCYAKCI